LKKDKVEFRKNVTLSKSTTKEAMFISTGKPIQIARKPKLEDRKRKSSFKDATKKRPSLKKFQEKKCPFPDLDLLGILDDLLERSVIELPEPKHREEAGRTANPKYCQCHRIISHTLEKCITLKEHIMQLAEDHFRFG